MGTLRALTVGMLIYILAMMLMFQPNLAVALGVGAAFASERMRHHHTVKAVRDEVVSLHRSLTVAKDHLVELQRTTSRRRIELNTAREELTRRDAIGSPAARELLKRQDEAIHAATQALESKQDQNNIVLESMQQLLSAQVEQTANMQRALRDVVGHLMANPRRQLTLNDSVLVNENVPSAPNLGGLLEGTGLDEVMAVTTES